MCKDNKIPPTAPSTDLFGMPAISVALKKSVFNGNLLKIFTKPLRISKQIFKLRPKDIWLVFPGELLNRDLDRVPPKINSTSTDNNYV